VKSQVIAVLFHGTFKEFNGRNDPPEISRDVRLPVKIEPFEWNTRYVLGMELRREIEEWRGK
jgi:hypothetical protein